MDCKKINKTIFDTIAAMNGSINFSFLVDDESDIIKFSLLDVNLNQRYTHPITITIDIEYQKKVMVWGEEIKYPSSIILTQTKNWETGEDNAILFNANYEINDLSSDIKFIIDSGDGRTEIYRRIMEIAPSSIPHFALDIIHQWLPKYIIYRDSTQHKDHCAKTVYFYNQVINLFKGFVQTEEIGGVPQVHEAKDIYKINHNSGFKYNMNRPYYHIKEYEELDSDDIRFTIQLPKKMLETGALIDKESKDNVYQFVKLSNELYSCNETYSIKKGKEMDRNYSIHIDSDGIISMIDYYGGGSLYSEVMLKREIIRNGNQITVLLYAPEEKEETP